MKIISLSNDPKIFETGSPVEKRQIEYGKIFEELHIFSRTGGRKTKKISKNVFAHPLKLSEINKIILPMSDIGITTQDPFEHGLIGVYLKLRFGVPLQIQLHTDFNNKYFLLSSPLNFIRFFLAHITLPFADGVRVVSERVKESIKELNSNITVLPIHTELKDGKMEIRKDEKIRILTVCRLEKEKDLETAIKAFKIVADKHPNITFTIAGEGSQKKKLMSLAKSYKLEAKICFMGWVSDLPKLYSEHYIYISTSLFEGYGMSIVEAAQAGLALVISNAGVAGELFKQNEGALIVEPKDVQGFANSLGDLVSDEELRSKVGHTAMLSAQKSILSEATYLDKYKKAIEAAHKEARPTFLGRLFAYAKSIFEGNKILRFIVGGGTAATSQILLLYLFTDIVGIWYLYSSILSYAIALVISFTLQKFWAFRDHGMETVHIQFFKYTLVALSGLVLNTAFMFLWVSVLSIWYLLAQIITGGIIAVYNFVMYKKFIFKHG